MTATNTIDQSEVHPLLRDVLPYSEKEAYLNGCCHIFALALSELTGLKIAAFVEDRAVIENNKTIVKDGLVHAFCLLDDQSNTIFDALGIRDVDKLNNEYNFHDGIRIRFFDDPNGILEFGHTFGVRDKDVDDYVRLTKDYIKTYLSDELQSLVCH